MFNLLTMHARLIFLVDSNTSSADIMVNHIERYHPTCKVKRFVSGEDMIQYLSVKPHLVIVDYQLDSRKKGAMNAAQIMDKIKSLGLDIPVVFVSGIQDIGAAMAMMEKGAKDYLFKTENLLKEIDEVIW